jgi:carbonic anhydrase
LVLGHSSCGAVQATLEELARSTDRRSQNLRSIVDRIRPSVERLRETWILSAASVWRKDTEVLSFNILLVYCVVVTGAFRAPHKCQDKAQCVGNGKPLSSVH